MASVSEWSTCPTVCSSTHPTVRRLRRPSTTEATFPILAAIAWVREYVGMLATPIRVRDIVIGQIGFFAFRLFLVAVIFVTVVVVLGAAHSAAIVWAVPAAMLTGLAFATPI